MSKVKCNVCSNEKGGICIIKKIGVAIKKPRICEAFIYNEAKLKAKQEIPTIKSGYVDQQAAKLRLKEELKSIRDAMKSGPSQGTAKDLGLIKQEESKIITPGDPGFYTTANTKHPLTGDLSRFLTTAATEE
jgi:hypothetical protein